MVGVRRPVLAAEDAEHRNVLGRAQHRSDPGTRERLHLGVADHLRATRRDRSTTASALALRSSGCSCVVARRREVGAQRAVNREVVRRRRIRPDEDHVASRSCPALWSCRARTCRGVAPTIFRLVSSCWPARTTWMASCSPNAMDDPVCAGVLGGEDELAVVGGAAGHRDVGRERRARLCVEPLEQADDRGRGRRDRHGRWPIFFTPLSMSACGCEERDTRTGRVERIRVRVGPVVGDDVRRDPRDPGLGHRLRDLALACGALVVDRRDDAGVVDRPHAPDRLVDVAAVVTRCDLDARAVGATALVERRRRGLERVRLVLQREHRRLEHRHEPDLQRWPRRDCTGRRPTGRGPCSRSSGSRRFAVVELVEPPPLLLLLHAAVTSASATTDARMRARCLDIEFP